MQKYELLNQIGDGTFGTVAKGVNTKTGQLVAVKKMKQKFYTWDECVRLPEVDVVRRIHGHPNIVKLREVVRENNELFFVFEYMDGDVLGEIKKARQAQRPEDAGVFPAIPVPVLKNYMQQILQALAYIHKRGFFHRDMKPENLLVKHEETSSGDVVKLADFGLVKEIRARPPFTDYVSTRWYRAPELLLQDRAYGAPVDIWATGCIMAELTTTKPLFPGSNEVDQLFRIMSTLGSPTEKTWPGGIQLGRKIRYTFPSIQGCGLAAVLPKHLPAQALDLISQMLTYDPKVRPTAEQCLQHPFFSVGIDENNEPSATALEQLAIASKRFQQQQQHQSPQSAPAAFGAVGDKAGGTATENGDKGGRRRGEAPASPPTLSTQKYYMVASPTKKTAKSSSPPPPPPPPPLGPKAAFGAGKADARSDKKTSPSHGGGSGAPGSSLVAQKGASNLKGLQLANLRSNALKNLTGAAGSGAGNSGSTAVGDVKGNQHGGDKEEKLGVGVGIGGHHRGPSLQEGSGGAGKKLMSGQELPREGGPSNSSGQAAGDSGKKKSASKGQVDLEGLMDEFSSEMTTLGLSAQKQLSMGGAESGTGASAPHKSSSMAKQDPVAALLSNSRYKTTTTNSSFGKGAASAVASNGANTRSPLGSVSVPDPLAQPSSRVDGDAYARANAQQHVVMGDTKGGPYGTRNSNTSSPSAPASNVTPSIKALLAKHRKSAYSTLRK